MAKRRKPKSHSGLRRFLGPGEKLRIRGASGRLVKRVYPDRNYVLEVTRKRKLVGYINPARHGKPTPKPFTRSMIQRLRHTTRQSFHESPRPIGKNNSTRISSKKFLKSQIPKRFLKKIRKNRGKAFNFRMNFKGNSLISHSIYVNSRISDENLKNLIVSDLLYSLGGHNFRISPKPKAVTDKVYTQRITELQLSLEFSSISKTKKGKSHAKPKASQKRKSRKR